MNSHDRLQSARLLLVTDPRPNLAARVEAALRGGVDVVQLRDKHAGDDELLAEAEVRHEEHRDRGAVVGDP
jgi:thiamine-phosphate pyrophosphorylase